MRSSLPSAALVLTLVVAPSSSTSAQAAPPRKGYERAVIAPELTTVEADVSEALRTWARHNGLRLEADPRLTLTARAALSEAPRTPGGRLDLAALRARAHRMGWTDGELAAVSVRLRPGADLGAAVASELQTRLGGAQPNQYGVGARSDADGGVALVLLSRRLVHLFPLPVQVKRGERLTVAGNLGADPAPRGVRLTLFVGYPGGEVKRAAMTLQGSAFEGTLEAGTTQGVLDVQVIIDRGRGPEIAAQLPVGVDHAPDEPEAPALDEAPAPEGDAAEVPEVEMARRVASLVLSARDSARVSLPATSAALDEVASAHAVDMRDHGFFAHVSPTTGDVANRLTAHGFRFSRALENLARASTPQEVVRGWLNSPAHRQNLLDPGVDVFGVGVALTASGDLVAVLVLARRADDGDPSELAARAISRLLAERTRRGLKPFRADSGLSAAAARHSAAASRREADPDFLDRVLAEHGGSSAAADEIVTASLEAVTRAQSLEKPFSRVGVGVAQGADGRLWITVVYVSD